jgi:FKBP-type peptidyl-prolyl cis-trans isomerase 2
MKTIEFLKDMVKKHPNDYDLGEAIRSYVVNHKDEDVTTENNIIKEGSTVSVHYTGKLTNDEVFDSSTGGEPLTVTLGEGSLIPGFEKALQGMKQGEKKTINIPCNEAYGDIIKDNYQEVDKQYVPDSIQVGQMLEAKNEMGVISVRVKEVRENTVVLDANHPLAGEDLIFDLEIVSVGDCFRGLI